MSKITPGAQLAWDAAARETAGFKHEFIEPEHLLLGLLGLERAVLTLGDKLGMRQAERDGALSEHDEIRAIFAAAGAEPGSFEEALRRMFIPGTLERRAGPVSRSPACKAAFATAESRARPEALSARHLLLAALELSSPGVLAAEKAAGAARGALAKAAAMGLPAGSSDTVAVRAATPAAKHAAPKKNGPAESYGRDLTELARQGKLGPFIGRREELLRCVQTLARSSKNNPLLVGEAGVGKTAIVEALAIRAIEGKDKVLAGRRIIEISLGALVAGTKMRGSFEERLQKILEEARRDPMLLVFIDEIHVLLGAGSAEGAADAANLLKPALARGELRCIGATTISEFRRYIEKDPALERRFERVDIPEPSREETLAILRGLKPKWEKHHAVSIDDAALSAAVDLSVRFEPDRQLPDKAIDLVDLAGARAQVPDLSLYKPGAAAAPKENTTVDARSVALVLAARRRLPIELVLAGAEGLSAGRLTQLETALKARVRGQDEAVSRVAKRLALAHAGLSERRGPLGVFLFMGPSGVGKTELAKALASSLFGGEDAIIRLDMSEYMEKHSVAKLIGSPPGYVGSEEEGRLVGALRTRPYSVVLLDEVEKADPQVLDIFLQVFDDGRLTDSKGRTADARHAVFVMTSNLGYAGAANRIGFSDNAEPSAPQPATPDLTGKMRPEFVNRIDEIIVFRSLARADAGLILDGMLAETIRLLKSERGVDLAVEPAARDLIVAAGFSAEFGARSLRRALEAALSAPLADLLASGKAARGSSWRAAAEGGAIILSETA